MVSLIDLDKTFLPVGPMRQITAVTAFYETSIVCEMSLDQRALDAIGDLSANFNFAANRLSDFGTITTLGYGLTWKPIPNVTLLWSMSDQEGAPTIQQVGNPNVLTPGVPAFV